MAAHPPPDGHSTPRRVIHWLMALLILPMVVVGLLMVQPGWPRAVQNTMFILHKNVGVLLLFLAILRIAIALTHRSAPLPDSLPRWQRRAAQASHGALYALILILPLTGYIRVRAGGFPVEALDRLGLPPLVPRSDTLAEAAKTLHDVAGSLLIVVLLLHIAAALQHALLKRDGIWSRMWPPFPR